MERRVILILGPTCSGKTKVGIELAEKLRTEIISADSRQIYKYLDIGTAKPPIEELAKVKHHFVDTLELNGTYNVSKFEHDALQVIADIHAKNKVPIVVGGSGLYIKALVDGIFDTVDVDEEYREELHSLRKKYGNEYLYNKLNKVDSEIARNMLPQNWKRVMRALEVYHISGEPISELQKKHKRELNVSFLQFGLLWERKVLYKNIDARVDQMIRSGLLGELENILQRGNARNLNALNTVGYKELISYFDREITLEKAIELIKRNTRRYAKRQLTWFRKDKRIKWFEVENYNDLGKIVENVIGIL
ncbi:MAG: tRNA (adenosine(37)-N6)-dimethylallyltransferase MiaA [Ignavibacteria bacterium RBG_13_36_8]|nr:MAG: tRNA (adenosine(37)-N6)-dimethylallyltransferase MiaA [Ignavibacteria bacterium RBG_13_36_8]